MSTLRRFNAIKLHFIDLITKIVDQTFLSSMCQRLKVSPDPLPLIFPSEQENHVNEHTTDYAKSGQFHLLENISQEKLIKIQKTFLEKTNR